MNPNQELWEKSDFTKIAATMRGADVLAPPTRRRLLRVLPHDLGYDLDSGDVSARNGRPLSTSALTF
jgi:hypothetical protein